MHIQKGILMGPDEKLGRAWIHGGRYFKDVPLKVQSRLVDVLKVIWVYKVERRDWGRVPDVA